ncbi:MAG: hypothetical protein ACQESK_01870 [Bacteroidota bacterium]
MKINIKKEISIGIAIGIIANLIGMFLYVAIFTDYAFERALETAVKFNVLGKIIALGAAINFLPFFWFLKKNLVYRARGVFIATIAAAVLTLILKFI